MLHNHRVNEQVKKLSAELAAVSDEVALFNVVRRISEMDKHSLQYKDLGWKTAFTTVTLIGSLQNIGRLAFSLFTALILCFR